MLRSKFNATQPKGISFDLKAITRDRGDDPPPIVVSSVSIKPPKRWKIVHNVYQEDWLGQAKIQCIFNTQREATKKLKLRSVSGSSNSV